MMRALFTAATGLNAQKTHVDVIANNLANVNTCGFKRQKVEFQDLIYEEVCAATDESILGVERPVPIELGSGVKVAATTRVFSQGMLKETGRNLDIAIQGEGFFQIELPDGRTAFTRNGEFHINSRGEMTTADGLRVANPNVTFDENTNIQSIVHAPDGTILAKRRDNPEENVTVGRLQLAVFRNPEGLKAIGNNLFIRTPASGAPEVRPPGENGAGQLMCGFCESSNVNVVTELIDMIIAQRSYEVNSRAIRTSDEMLQTANQLLR
ncbi:MAG: flagellar basal-body rod protein FlgG [Planctomycetota bacterium]|jgi:flagellar basal-body rod protein FlgG|nr:flagellar basal-body rod protein FlgG [Planctomycetota bacterium]MDP6503998.1 flagellar basal-body rod protein FlgG [Planctomycetota bacterium]